MENNQKKGIIPVVIIILAVLTLMGYLCLRIIVRPNFELSTDKTTLEAGQEFDPDRYIASVSYADIKDILVDNPVQSGIIGTYEVTYTLRDRVKTLSVTVEDTTAPELKLTNDVQEFYSDEEIPLESLVISVNDGTDVSLAIDEDGQDFTVPGYYWISVVATDVSGNKTKKFAPIVIKEKDITPPEILGAVDIVITEGDSLDLVNGIVVVDDLDDEPSFTIDAGEYDKNVPGEYTITYTAKDASGNESTASRMVRVEPEIIVPVQRPEGIEPFTGDVTNFCPTGGTVTWDATGKRKQPYLVCVNRAMCTVTVYGKDENGNYTIPVKAMACSVGKEGHETITGVYKTSDRFPWCYMVDSTWGRYAIRIQGGYMFHSICYFEKKEDTLEYEEFNKLGSPASLGCVRLCLADIYWLYAYCPTGFTTVIYDDYELAGPLGKPSSPIIDTTNELTRGWDPTDPEYPY